LRAVTSNPTGLAFFGISLPVVQVGGGLIVGVHRVPEAIFSYLNRNAVHEERRYGMPMQQVVEIGTQIYL
jgi:K+ transporter